MTTFTVLIPTHNHADTLRYAVRSVLWQTCQEFELFIVGDGVQDRTREIVAELAAEDARIRFFDFPKGDRNGELHRYRALQEANGRFVAYQADDDLWLPEHLASLAELLEDHDLVHCMQMEVSIDGKLSSWLFDAHADPLGLDNMRNSLTGFGLSTGAHRLDAYRRLPLGWHPAPQEINTDLYFWLQFLDESWCRYRSYKWPNVLHLSSASRKDWDIERRVEELRAWWDKIQTSSQRDFCVKQCLLGLHDELFATESMRGPALGAEIAKLTEALCRGATVTSRLNVYALGEELSFRSRGNADRYLLSGYWVSEAWGRWTSGTMANMILPLAAPIDDDVELELEILPFFYPPSRSVCAFSVQINGVVVLNAHETRGGINRYTVTIPKAQVADVSVLVLSFIAESPVRPVDLGISIDPRLLGVGLVSLRLSALQQSRRRTLMSKWAGRLNSMLSNTFQR